MKKYKISKKTAKSLDYLLCTLAYTFAFWADWKIGVALLCFDAMRAFENIGAEIDNVEKGNFQKED